MMAASGGPDLEFRPETTLADALFDMRRWFLDAGVDTPDLDARMLMAAVLGIDAATLIMHGDRALGSKAAVLAIAASRRRAREPVSRIIGTRAFYGREFCITRATLDPRPDTETLIDTALSYVRGLNTNAPIRILDVGTGTGCLLVTLLAELPSATGVGTDICADALAVAQENARRHQVADRASWQLTDGLDGIDTTFDLLVANPPYIRTADIAHLAPEVTAGDPHLALDGGADGLRVYRRIVSGIHKVVPTGYAIFEIGYDQASEVKALLSAHGKSRKWPVPEVRQDLAGQQRCVTQITRF